MATTSSALRPLLALNTRQESDCTPCAITRDETFDASCRKYSHQYTFAVGGHHFVICFKCQRYSQPSHAIHNVNCSPSRAPGVRSRYRLRQHDLGPERARRWIDIYFHPHCYIPSRRTKIARSRFFQFVGIDFSLRQHPSHGRSVRGCA